MLSSLWGWLTKHIKRIRESNDQTKRRWMIGMTTAIMIFLIVLWVAYLNFALPVISEDGTQADAQEVQQVSTSSAISRGFQEMFSGISNGTSRVFQGVQRASNYVQELFIKEREIRIQPN